MEVFVVQWHEHRGFDEDGSGVFGVFKTKMDAVMALNREYDDVNWISDDQTFGRVTDEYGYTIDVHIYEEPIEG